jgi:hypothetical protein
VFLLNCSNSWGQGTEIIGQVYDSLSHCTIVSYNYVTHNYDSLYHIPGATTPFNGECAIDGFNGRYFFGASISGYPNYTIFSFDLTSHILTPLFQMNTSNSNDRGIEYDCYSNSLIYHSNDSIRKYDINTGIITALGQVPHSYLNGMLGGYSYAYNYTDQKYFYADDLTGNSDWYWVYVDVNNTTNVDTIFVPWTSMTSQLKYDKISNDFYGTNNGNVIKIDPVTGNTTTICVPPINFSSEGPWNFYDAYNGYYLQSYTDGLSNINYLAITDVANSSIITIDSLPIMFFSELNPEENATIKQVSNELIAGYAFSYQWNINNTPIPGATNQNFIPNQSGNYNVTETHLDGRISNSNKINVTISGINNNLNDSENAEIFPNPFSNQINIISHKNEPIEFKIFNTNGQTITSTTFTNNATVSTNKLPSGVYFFELTMGKKKIKNGKIIKQ